MRPSTSCLEHSRKYFIFLVFVSSQTSYSHNLQLNFRFQNSCWETSSTSATSAEQAEDHIGWDRSVRPRSVEQAEDRIGWDRSVRTRPSTDTQTGTKERRFGAETGRPLGKIFRREYILGVCVELLNEHWSTVSTSVSPPRTCIKRVHWTHVCIENSAIEHIFE